MSPEQISIPLLQGKEPVHGGSDLAAHIPVIQRRCHDDYITFLHRRINFAHVILLDTETFAAAVAAKTAFTAVNIHAVKEKLRHSISGAFRAFRYFF